MTKYILSAFCDEAASGLDGQIAALKRNGIRFAELRNIDARCVIDYPACGIKDIRRRLDDSGISVSAVGSPIGKFPVTRPLSEHMDAFSRALEAAHILGTKRIRMFSFFIPADKEPGAYRDEVLSRLSAMLDLAEKADIQLCHENEKGIYGDTAARNLKLCEAFGGRLRLIFDPANYIQCKEKPSGIFAKLLPYIDYMHIKDAFFYDGAVVPPGCGDGHIPELLRDFSSSGGERFLTVEPHLTVFEGLTNLQDKVLKHRYTYESAANAFDTAVNALKNILENGGHSYE